MQPHGPTFSLLAVLSSLLLCVHSWCHRGAVTGAPGPAPHPAPSQGAHPAPLLAAGAAPQLAAPFGPRRRILGCWTITKPLETLSCTALTFAVWPWHRDLARGSQAWLKTARPRQCCKPGRAGPLCPAAEPGKEENWIPAARDGLPVPIPVMLSCPSADKKRDKRVRRCCAAGSACTPSSPRCPLAKEHPGDPGVPL